MALHWSTQRITECSANSEVRAAALCPAHRELAVACASGDICVFEVATGRARERYALADCWITALQFAAGSSCLIVGTLERGGWWIDRVRKLVKPLEAPIQNITALAVSPCRWRIAFVGDDCLVVGNGLPEARWARLSLREVPNPNSVAWSPDGTRVAVGGGEGADECAYLGLADAASLTLRSVTKLGEDMLCVDAVSFSQNGECLLAGGYKSCALMRLEDAPVVEETLPLTSWCAAVAFCSDGSGIIAGDENGWVSVRTPSGDTPQSYCVGERVLGIAPHSKRLVEIIATRQQAESRRWTVQIVRLYIR